MSKYSTLKAEIIASIKRNGAQAITGDLLQEKLLAMIDSLGEYYQFGGLASPSAEFTPGDEPVVFIAATPGTYTNFGGLVVADSEVALLVWDGSAWSKQTTDIATRTEVSQLGQDSLIYYPSDIIAGSLTGSGGLNLEATWVLTTKEFIKCGQYDSTYKKVEVCAKNITYNGVSYHPKYRVCAYSQDNESSFVSYILYDATDGNFNLSSDFNYFRASVFYYDDNNVQLRDVDLSSIINEHIIYIKGLPYSSNSLWASNFNKIEKKPLATEGQIPEFDGQGDLRESGFSADSLKFNIRGNLVCYPLFIGGYNRETQRKVGSNDRVRTDYISLCGAKTIEIKNDNSLLKYNIFLFGENLNYIRIASESGMITASGKFDVSDANFIMFVFGYLDDRLVAGQDYRFDIQRCFSVSSYPSVSKNIEHYKNIYRLPLRFFGGFEQNSNGCYESGIPAVLSTAHRAMLMGFLHFPDCPIQVAAKSGYKILVTRFDANFVQRFSYSDWTDSSPYASIENKEWCKFETLFKAENDCYFGIQVAPENTSGDFSDTSITIDDVLSIQELNIRPEICQEKSIGEKICDFPISGEDITAVKNELWCFANSPDDLHQTYVDVRRYSLDFENGTAELLGTFGHNWGHANTVDYCEQNGCLIVGNGSGNSDIGEKNAFYIFENIYNKRDNQRISVSEAVLYEMEDWGSTHKQLNAVWGDDNNGNYNKVIIFDNNGKIITIRTLLLGRGSNTYEGGTYQSPASENGFNGTYKVIKTNNYAYSDYVCLQGGTGNNGSPIMGISHDGIQIANYQLLQQETGYLRSKQQFYLQDGTLDGVVVAGVARYKEYFLVSIYYSSSQAKVIAYKI